MAFSEQNLKIVGIIPARYASTRFPGKPLAIINGFSMIERVYRQVQSCHSVDEVVVATDDQRIFDHVEHFGGKVVMTAESHRSGTDRLGEAIQLLENEGLVFDIAVNVQGDEPYIQPGQIEKVISLFSNPETKIATLIKKIEVPDELFNPNVVKVLTDVNGQALMFSRHPIPYYRGLPENEWIHNQVYWKHIGIYAYSAKMLKQLILLSPAPPEIAESLEQLRWLWNGYRIYTETTDFETIGIDTPEDLLKLTNIS